MNCPHCNYPLTARSCENPGCIEAYWRTPDEKRTMAERYARERAALDAQTREREYLARAQRAAFAGLILLVVVALAACHRPVANINTADTHELTCLPGITMPMAQAIIDHRKRFGPYRVVGELAYVQAISPAELREILPFVATYGETNICEGEG